MQQVIGVLFNGLSLSSILLLTAVGLAITFGLMKVINMAHGEFIMMGAYTTFVVQQLFLSFAPGAFDLSYLVALVAAFAFTFLFGCVLEKLVISRLYGRVVDSLLATAGISIILQQAARSIFGERGVNVTAPSWLSGGISLGGVTFSYNRLFIIMLAVLSLVLVVLIMRKTKFGLQMRAVMQNRDMARCMGINSRRIDMLTFGIGSGLAGLAGCSVALLGSVDSTVGQLYIVDSFMAVVLGGVGNLVGTVFGSSIIGFSSIGIETGLSSADIAKCLVLLIIIVFLQFKPQGLFAGRTRQLDE
ncbi:MAG: urea ABC transporter permease subunit UrtB [Coriobacteriales bacterium]|jgi:urea transport system permease protein|nr:urea ABC transporter permease subunit UrtB [Coriobacteriales bacterium]